MKKVVNFLCNTPLYVGLGVLYVAVAIKYVSNKLFDLSFFLHQKAGTDIGLKITNLTAQVKEFAEALKAQKQANGAESNKLLRVLRPDQNGPTTGVFQIGKKPTTDN